MYGTAFFVKQRQPLLHQQRPRRARHRHAFAGRFRGDQPRQADRAHASLRPAPAAVQRALVARRVRQPAHRRPQRQRDRALLARENSVAGHAAFIPLAGHRLRAGRGRRRARSSHRVRSGTAGSANDRRAERSAHGARARAAGEWHPYEDFRWASEFAAFLTTVDTEGRGRDDLVLNGDTFELLQSATATAQADSRGGLHGGRGAGAVGARADGARRGDRSSCGVRPGRDQPVVIRAWRS